jgi:hypothetical protein
LGKDERREVNLLSSQRKKRKNKMYGFEVVLKTKKEELCIRNFIDIIEKQSLIYFSENFIEIPGIAIFIKKERSLLSFLNPSIEIIKLKEETFKIFYEMLLTEKEDTFVTEKKTYPSGFTRLNLNKLKEEAILIKKTVDSIQINNFYFTFNELEFQGLGMFTANLNVIFVEKEDFDLISEKFI